jgi:hypothetical protein
MDDSASGLASTGNKSELSGPFLIIVPIQFKMVEQCAKLPRTTLVHGAS